MEVTEKERNHIANDLGNERSKVGEGAGSAADLPMSYCHWTSRGLGGSVWQWLTGDVWGRSPETSGNDGLVVEHGHQKISRGNCCGGESRCLLVCAGLMLSP